MTSFLVAVLSAFALSAASGDAPRTASFSVLVERTERGWSASCDQGCLWQRVSVECRAACEVLVDAIGMTTELAAVQRAGSFAFVLSPRPGGAFARPVAGTQWTETSWRCDEDGCRVQVTERGVTRVVRL